MHENSIDAPVPTEIADLATGSESESDRRLTLITAVATGIAATIVAAWLFRPASRLDFFFDEMWRVDQVTSANPARAYLDGPAPIPPGWVGTIWSTFQIIPSRRPLIRASGAIWLVPAAIFLGLTFRLILRRSADGLWLSTWAALSSVLCVTTVGVAAHIVYFNNYLADLAVAAALILLLALIDVGSSASTRVWACVVILAGLAPWFGQGALFLLPAAALLVFRYRAVRPRFALASGVAAAISGLVVGLVFVLPVSANGTIEDFWFSDTPAAGIGNFLRRFGSSFVDSAYPPWVHEHRLYVAGALGLTAAGLVILQRAWAWWLPLYGSAQLLALGAALTVGWPGTFVRVSASFQILVYAGAPVALVSAAAWVIRLLNRRLRSRATIAAIGAALCLLLCVLWWPRGIAHNSESTSVFARGLTNDLQLVADMAVPGDLVVAYHLSGPYVRTRILNADDVAPDVDVIDEARDERVTVDLDQFTAASTHSVWCVIPYEAGPDATDAACRLDPAGWTETLRTTLSRAAIVRLDRVDTAAGG